MLFRALRYSRRKMREWQLLRQLRGESGYSFSTDYVSVHVENWEKLLEEYRGRPNVRMLEIGSFEGRSAVWLLENILTHPTSSIVCVDLFTDVLIHPRFDHNVRISGAADRITKLKGPSEEVLSGLPLDHFDIVYIDGSHEAIHVLMDGMLSWFLLKPGGVMVFDDYLWDTEKPARNRPQMAIDLFLKCLQGHYDLLLKDYQVAVRKKTSNISVAASSS